MSLKRIFAALLALCLVLSMGAYAEGTTGEKAVAPLLYEVTDDEGNVIWLFGSIHMGAEYYYPLPDYVYNAFDSADGLAVEIDMTAFMEDPASMFSVLEKMKYADGTTITDHISQETYEKAVRYLNESGQYIAYMDRFTAGVWSILLEGVVFEAVGADSELGVDMHMLDRAYEDNKPVIGIETADFQFDMINGLSDPLQVLLLEDTLEYFDDAELHAQAANAMLDAWAAGDAEALLESNEIGMDMLTDEEQALYDEYQRVFIDDRNDNMTDFAENALKDGEKLFICVGALHVVGETGMASQLAARGYEVTAIGGNPME